MRLNYALCCFYCVLNYISAFNFFPKYAQVFSDNTPGSYFGFSVLLQAAGTNSPARVVIGSPRSNSSFTQLQGIQEPGAVYSCYINGGNCEQFLFNLNANVKEQGPNKVFLNRKDNGWLGAVVDGKDVASGNLVACSPRWINAIHKHLYYLQNGLCYLLDESVNVQRKAKTLVPLINEVNQGYRTNESVYYYALGEAGMSVHFAKDTTELLFGAPGVLQWKGMIGRYYGSQLKYVNIPNPHHIPRLQDFSYFGYAVSSGKFTKSSSEVWYVGGAPRGQDLFGQVLVYDYGTKQDDLKIFYEMSGQQEGEYFGAAVSVGDVNGDGVDDVIVGSPMYASSNHYDVGLVYVYINKLDTIQRNFERTIINPPSPANGIRFGTAVSVIGDVNHDGYADLAIGAPYYNDGQGAIFIYLGSHTGITEQYSQRILASDVSNNLRGFGASFSRGIDVDNNNYKDLAVGSFLSSHAVVLKTRPVVTIHPVLKSKRTQISTDVRTLQISACIKYTGTHLPDTLNVRITIDADDFYKRVSFKDSRGTMWEVVKDYRYKYNQEACDDFEVLIVNTHSDFTQPIVFKMMYELIEHVENGFCATCPVVDKRLANYTTLSIHYETGCGSDVCRPDLKLAAQFDYHKNHLVIGEEEKIDVAVNIRNTGEPAYATKFYAEIPSVSNFVKIPDMCQHVSDNVLLCELGNLMKKNDMKSLLLPLDVSMFGNNDQLVVKLNVTSSGEEVEPSDNIIVLNLTLKTEVRISVIGISNPEQFNFIQDEQLKQENLTFTHQYTVQNLGPSPLDDLELIFWIPQNFGSEENNVVQVYKPEVQAEGTSMTCRTTSPQGFYIDPFDTPTIIEADDPTASGSTSRASRTRRQSPRSDIKPPDDANDTSSAEELNLPMDNPEVFTRVQKLIASDRELPEGLQENRTLVMGCGGDKENCMEVRCTSGVLKKNSRAVVTFKMLANLTALDEKRGEKDTIVITSSVQPISKYFTVNKTYTHTLLQGNVRQESPWKWIILGLILGIILLFVIIYALYRAGFFKRTEHEKLMNEKEETFGELTEQTD